MKNERRLSDRALIQHFLNGNQSAFEKLLARYQQRIFSSILLMVRDLDVANDIMQDTLIKVMCSLQEGKYEDKGKFGIWVMRIAHNHAMNHFRSRRVAMVANTCDSDTVAIIGEEFSDLNIEEQAVLIEERKDVHRMLKFLPKDQQQIVQLRYYSNLSFKEISELLKINLNTALGRMHYAVQNLRKMMVKRKQSLQTVVA